MTRFDKLKERFPDLIPIQELRSTVSIIELALHYGYEVQLRKGRSRPVLRHPSYQDTVIIKNPKNPSQQVYQCVGNFADSGTLIDFVRNRLSTAFTKFNRIDRHELRNITDVLYDYLRIVPTEINQNKKTKLNLLEVDSSQKFIVEHFDIRPLYPTNYLNKRHITVETLQRPEFIGKVMTQIVYFNPQTGHVENFLTVRKYPEQKYYTFNNVAFPYYNGVSGNVTGLELRNENIKLHALGSDRHNSVFLSNTPIKTLNFYVMESAIDALSHQQIRNTKGDNEFNALYFSTGGQLSNQQVYTIMHYISTFDKEPSWKINLAFDNDIKGCKFDLQFVQQLVSDKLSMSANINDSNRCIYTLLKSDAYKAVQVNLMSRIDTYNKLLTSQYIQTATHPADMKKIINEQIFINQSTDQIMVSIPESRKALLAFCHALLESTGISERIIILKAKGKDFNEDLVSGNKKV